MRTGEVLFRNGNIITKKGVMRDPRQIGVVNEETQNHIDYEASKLKQYSMLNKEIERLEAMVNPKRENPELDVEKALQNSGSYKSITRNIDFSLFGTREIQSTKSMKKMPSFMQFTAQRYQLNHMNHKSLQMNNFESNQKFKPDDLGINLRT